MDSWNILTAVEGKGGGDRLKEGEGIRQRPYMKGPWKWTMVWVLTMEVEGRQGRGGAKGGNWDN